MEEFQKLKKTRKSIKTAITRLQNWLSQNQEADNLFEFQNRAERLQTLFKEYETCQGAIENFETDEVLGIVDTEDRAIIEDQYFNLLSKFQANIKKLSLSNNAPQNVTYPQLFAQTDSTQHNCNLKSVSVKLPDIRIEPFSGKITDFESFFQLFDALIVQNSSLSDIQKFVYLKSYLKGESLKLIDSLKVTNENFQIAIDTLKSRYENKTSIINSYLTSMFDTQNMSKCTSSLLREFVSNTQKNIQSLKNLNLSYEQLFNVTVIHLLQKKLDYSTKRAFEMERDHDKLPNLENFIKFIEKRCVIMESIETPNPALRQTKNSLAHHSLSNTNSKTSQNSNCTYCNKTGHRIYTCFQFKNLQLNDKMKFVKSKNLCQNCLGRHNYENCASTQACSICSRLHNTLLHRNSDSQNHQNKNCNNALQAWTTVESNQKQKIQSNASLSDAQSNSLISSRNISPNSQGDINGPSSSLIQNDCSVVSSNSAQTSLNNSAISIRNSYILLATAKVTLFSKQGEPVTVKALLDSGSQNSFITKRLTDKLQCSPYDLTLNISGISENSTTSNKMVNVSIHSNLDKYKKFNISCAILPKITCKLPQACILVNDLQLPQTIQLADNEFFIPSQIDILLGSDIYYDLIKPNIVSLGKNRPVLQDTHLGWIVAGKIPQIYAVANTCAIQKTRNQNISLITTFQSDHQLDNLLTKFWNIEELSEPIIQSKEDELVDTIFKSTTKILDNGRFQVNIPLKTPSEYQKLGDSFSMAKKRFSTLEKRFEKDKLLFQEYSNFIDEYISLGHAQVVPFSPDNKNFKNKYFIPHLCVIREASVTTKLRVVFDASCKSSSGLSLNDICLKGYQVQPELFHILCRFRSFPVVLTTDIQKMYRQILVNPDQRFLQNILWRKSTTDNLHCIQLNTVTYGTNSAPFLATKVLKEIAILNSKEFPLASEALLSQFYMDDGLCGAANIEELRKLHDELNTLLSRHGFSLHKYCSNSQSFLESISERAMHAVDMNFDKSPNKVLGLKWDPISDYLCISAPKEVNIMLITKRNILSILAQCYDPIGLINPVTVKGKMLMQKLWAHKFDWDTKIESESILEEWKSFSSNLPLLSRLQIPRFYFLNKSIKKIEIHGFADASLLAYGGCVFFRTVYSNNTVSCTLISSKSRIAPIKSVTLPRLELCAMLLLSKLIKKLIHVFHKKIEFDSVNLWTDSEIALYWCKSHASRWSVFVSHRVSQIQEITSNYTWRHVKSQDNVADLLSRGMNAQEILTSRMWWQGPSFLHKVDLDLTEISKLQINPSNIPEERKINLSIQTVQSNNFWSEIFGRFSQFLRLQRTIAFLLRFTQCCKGNKISGTLKVNELILSKNFIIQKVQEHHLSKELSELKSGKLLSNKSLIPFKPFLDENNLIRVGGRLDNADIPYQQKYPILLPSKNHTVNLLLKHEHARLGHSGAQTVLSNIRLNYWPLNGLRAVKKIIKDCATCARFNARPLQQIMASLPKDRVSISRPFQKTGVDFGGPFMIKSSRLRRAPLVKAYISLFVCMVTKAVHIETVTSLSTDAFIMTLKRFISRRGNPSIIFSDNATNFSGANNQLKELYDFFKNREAFSSIADFLSQNQTTWKFIPPGSPHWGGIWEAAIKGAKNHMRKLLGNTNFTFEEFSTSLAQIEAIMNSRPLCPLSNDPSDLNSLTPGHFLIGCSLTAYPEKDLANISENRLSIYQRIQKIQQSFWKRWSVEYLNCLQNRPKWIHTQENLKENDLVLIKEDNLPPLKWALARVVEVLPGKDGKVRVAKIKTASGIFTRPITKLCPLPK